MTDDNIQRVPNNPDAPERGLVHDKKDWPDMPRVEMDDRPIDLLKPGSQAHDRVLDYLLHRLNYSEEKMSHFYARWRVMEKKVQAYIDLPDWEKTWKEMNNQGKKPSPTSIVVPYSFSTISTIVTYLLHTFTGRKPMFQVGTYKDETSDSSRMMETVLQYNADHSRLIKHLWEFLQATQVYGVGFLRSLWVVDKRTRTVTTRGGDGSYEKSRERRVVYEGNDVESVDPFLAFPDPRVPMCEVNRRGEFFFWRTFEGRHILKADEAAGIYKFVDNASQSLPRNYGEESARAIMSGGSASPGARPDGIQKGQTAPMQVDQGTIDIIPAELGIGDSEEPQKWLFTIINKSQIVQAEHFNADHDMHPVAVSEPYSLGKSFGSPAIGDYLGPLQDMMSWLINCFDDETEILTERGFVKFIDLEEGEKVAAVNPEDESISYEEPQEYFSKPYAGKMIKIESSRLDMLVTPNHRMWLARRNKDFGIVLAEDMEGEYRLRPTLCGGEIQIGNDEEFIFEERKAKRDRGAKQRYQQVNVNVGDMAEFLGWYVSEGSLNVGEGKSGSYSVSLRQKEERYVGKVEDAVNALGFHTTMYMDKKGGFSWTITDKRFAEFVLEACGKGSAEKRVPDWLRFCSEGIIDRFLRAAIDGDGQWVTASCGKYITTSKQLADGIQELMLLIGWRASIVSVPSTNHWKDQWRVNFAINSNDAWISPRNYHSVYYEGGIHCVSTSTGLIMVRRNGKVAICGQSHQDNVRKVLNDMVIVDPSMVEMQDIKDPKPGGIIRLKRAAQGRDVRTAIHQMQVHDVTTNHIKDAELFMRLGQQLSAVTENVMGVQAEGGRKTATEVRTSTEAAASRLAAQARIISAQGLVDLTEQWAVNVQQYMTRDFYLRVVGREGEEKPLHVTPDQVSGDFYYPVHDGTLPMDKTALFEIWSQIFQVALKDEAVRSEYSIPRLFEHVAELGGAKNIESFRLRPQQDDEIQRQVQAGNLVTPDELSRSLGEGDDSNNGGSGRAVPEGGGFNPGMTSVG